MACVCSTVWRQPSSRSTVYTPTVKPAAPVINCHTKSSARRAVAHIALAAASLGPPRAWLLRCSAAPLLCCIAVRHAHRRVIRFETRAPNIVDLYRRIQYSIFEYTEYIADYVRYIFSLGIRVLYLHISLPRPSVCASWSVSESDPVWEGILSSVSLFETRHYCSLLRDYCKLQ